MNGTGKRRKGYLAENDVVKHLRANGFPYAERRSPGTSGPDITGTPGIAWEIKNCKAINLAGWVDQAEDQRASTGNTYSPVVYKRQGTTNPDNWYTILPLWQFLELLEEAGHAAPPDNKIAEYQARVRALNETRRGNGAA